MQNEKLEYYVARYHQYITGEISQDEWFWDVYSNLGGLISNTAAKIQMDRDDYRQQVAMLVLRKLDKYNPERNSLPKTFFFMEVTKEAVGNFNAGEKTLHVGVNKLLKTAISKGWIKAEKDLSEQKSELFSLPDNLIVKVCEYTHVSLKLYKKAKEAYCSGIKTGISIDDTESNYENYLMSDESQNPETLFIEREQSNIVQDALSNLNSLERLVVDDWANKVSLFKTVEKIKSGEFAKYMFDGEIVDNTYVQSIFNTAIKKLKERICIKAVPKKQPVNKEYDVAFEKDIINSFLMTA